MAGASTSRDRLITLDGLRGLAAIAVAAGHLGFLDAHSTYPLAVDFFFMLSGYVLLRTYEGRLSTPQAVNRYLVRRAIRLAPLFVIGLLVGASVYLAGDYPIPTPAIWRDYLVVPLNPPGWSLVYEVVGSAAVGFGLWRRWGWLQILLLLFSACGIVIAIWFRGSPNGGWVIGQVHWAMCRLLFGFSVGALVFKMRAPRPLPWWVITVPFVAAFLSPFHGPAVQLAMVFLLFPALLWLGTRTAPMPFGRQLGDLSYPLYILHMPLFWIVRPLPMFAQLCIAVVVSFAALKLFDEPIRRLLTNLSESRRT